MLKFKSFIIIISLFYSISSLAYAPEEGHVTSYFGPFLYKTNFSGSKSGAYSPVLGGVGLVVNGDVSDKGSLEIAIFQMNKTYFREDAGNFMAEQTSLTHITMGYRWWLSERYSTSLTFFSAYSMGQVQIIHSDFAPGAEIDTSARDKVEYGFDFAVQAELYSRKSYAVVLDTRYSKSVTNKKDEYGDHYGVMLALQFSIQEKN